MDFTLRTKSYETHLLIEAEGHIINLDEYHKLTMSYLKHISESSKESVIVDERALHLPTGITVQREITDFYIHDLPTKMRSLKCALVDSKESIAFSKLWAGHLRTHGLNAHAYTSMIEAIEFIEKEETIN